MAAHLIEFDEMNSVFETVSLKCANINGKKDDPERTINNFSGNHIMVLQPSFPTLKLCQPKNISSASESCSGNSITNNNRISNQSSSSESAGSNIATGSNKAPALNDQTNSNRILPDDIWGMWSIASRAKQSIPQGHRLENLTWRLWHLYKNLSAPLINSASNILLEIQSHQDHQKESCSNGIQETPITYDKNSDLIENSPTTDSLSSRHCESGELLFKNSNNIFNNKQRDRESVNLPVIAGTEGVEAKVITGNSIMNNNNNSDNRRNSTNTRRKKNMQKFMQKYQSKLSDIKEQIVQKQASEEDVIDSKEDQIGTVGEEPTAVQNSLNAKPSKNNSQKIVSPLSPTLKVEKPAPRISLLSILLDQQHLLSHLPELTGRMAKENDRMPQSEGDFLHDNYSGASTSTTSSLLLQQYQEDLSGSSFIGQTPPSRPSAPVFSISTTMTPESTHHPQSSSMSPRQLSGSQLRSPGVNIPGSPKPNANTNKNATPVSETSSKRSSLESNDGSDYSCLIIW